MQEECEIAFVCACECVHMCMHLYTCVVLCNFISCIYLCNHNQNQDIELVNDKERTPSYHLFVFTPTSHRNPPPPCHQAAATLVSISIVLVILVMLHKWNHIGCNLLQLLFFLVSIVFLRSIQTVVCISSSFLFIAETCSIVWVYQVCSTIHTLKTCRLFPVFFITMKLLTTLLCGFYVNISFYSSVINAQEYDGCAIW